MKFRPFIIILIIILIGFSVLCVVDPTMPSRIRDFFSSAENGKTPPPSSSSLPATVPGAPKGEYPGPASPPANATPRFALPPAPANAVDFLTPAIRSFAISGGISIATYRDITDQLANARQSARTVENETRLVDLSVSKLDEIRKISDAYIAWGTKPASTLAPRPVAPTPPPAAPASRTFASAPAPAPAPLPAPSLPASPSSVATAQIPSIFSSSTPTIASAPAQPRDAPSPLPPTGLVVIDRDLTSVTLRWAASPSPYVTGYKVSYSISYSELQTQTNETTFRITTLQPDTEYTFYVRALGEVGATSQSVSVTARTKSYADAFVGTWTSTSAGYLQTYVLEADGTYKIQTTGYPTMSGVWRVNKNTINWTAIPDNLYNPSFSDTIVSISPNQIIVDNPKENRRFVLARKNSR